MTPAMRAQVDECKHWMDRDVPPERLRLIGFASGCVLIAEQEREAEKAGK